MKNLANWKKTLLSMSGVALASMIFVGSAAADEIKNKLIQAESSPLFQQKFSSSEISAKNLDRVVMQNGAELNFKKYAALTRLDTNEKFEPLMNPQTVSRYLRSEPTYRENVIQMEDRLIVERTLLVEMKEDTCKKNSLPEAVDELCFKAKDGEIPKESREYLVNVRNKLKKARPEAVIKQGRTAQQMLTMSDRQLLELLLNSGDRKVRLVSVLPTRVYNKRTSLSLWNTNTKLKASNFERLETKALTTNQQYNAAPATPQNESKPRNQVFPTKYFLTGYTIGRSIEDEFEIEFSEATLISDRYYVRFSYQFSAGFGLRFPFSVSASSKATDDAGGNDFKPMVATYAYASKQGSTSPSKGPTKTAPIKTAPAKTAPTKSSTGKYKAVALPTHGGGGVVCGKANCGSTSNAIKSAKITMSVAPVNVNSNGHPAYSAVGLPQSKYFDGKEFVLKFHASCQFKASIPGPNITANCPTIDKDYGRQINPVIGSARARLGELWIDGKPLGLGIDVWAGEANLDFGIQANITNGRIHMLAKGFNNTKIRGAQNSALQFNSTSPITFDVKNNSSSAAFAISDPSYGFDLELLPVARMKLNLDLGYYELKKTLGPYGIDALSLNLASFSLPHHAGTVKSHIYIP